MTRSVLEVLGPSAGGIRRHVDVLARHLPAEGWEATVAGPRGVMEGLATDAHPVPVALRPDRVVSAARAVRRLSSGAEVVHAHGLTAGWTAVLARTGLPIVLTIHNVVLDSSGPRARLMQAFEARLPRRVDHVIAVSPAIAAQVEAAVPTTVIIPASEAPVPTRTAGEIREVIGIGADVPLVVTVGRLHPQKAIPVLLEATRKVRESVPDVVVAVVGDGPLKAELEALAVELGVDGCVSFVGAQADGVSWLAAADVVAMSSRWEGSPLVVAEAMQLGRPVVATDVGDLREVIQDGVTGRLVPVGDPAALADAVVALLADHRAAGSMAAAGQGLAAERYGTQGLVAAVADVYRSVAGRSQGSA